MKYLKTFERYNYTDNNILNDILNIITETKPKSYICDSHFYNNGMFWVSYRYIANSKKDKINKKDIYNENNEILKSKLESLNIMDKIEITYSDRIERFPPKLDITTNTLINNNYGSAHKTTDSLYELRCQIKNEYISDILRDINTKLTAKNYNL